jgi:hypothetical protein
MVTTTDSIEKHYYSPRGNDDAFGLSCSRADTSADLGYRSMAHDHPYGDGSVSCSARCRRGKAQEPTLGAETE